MDLSIIIPSFNTKKLLERCLTSVFSSLKGVQFFYEVIVVDNASTDGSPELVNNKFPQVHLLCNKKNLGFGRANNQGIQKAKGSVILLLNSDTEVLDRGIETLYRFAQKHPMSFVGGKLLNENLTPQPSCGPEMSLPVVFFMLFTKGDVIGITRYSPRFVTTVDWVSGACMVGFTEAFATVGLFDEGIFMYMDEIDFLYRAKHKGYSILFYPDARFIHTGAASSGSTKVPVMNIYRGLLYFYKKHRSIIELRVLSYLLTMKAKMAIALGTLLGKRDLVSTYEKALTMV